MVDTPEGMSPMEAAGLIHAESGDIADVVTKMALADGKNVIFDITMTTSGSVTGRIKKAKAHGYDEFTGVYIDVPLEVSLKSAQERYIRGAQEYTDGVGYGGRYVPESAIMRAQVPGSDKTRNRQVFEGLTASKVFTATEIWDNNRQDENGNRQPAALIERTTTNGKEHHRPVRSRGSDDGRRETSTQQRTEGSGNRLGHDSGVRRPAGSGRSTDQDSSSRNAREDHDGTSKRNVQPRSNNIHLNQTPLATQTSPVVPTTGHYKGKTVHNIDNADDILKGHDLPEGMKAVIGAYGEIALKFPNKESEREYRKKHGKNFLNVTTGAQAALHDAVKNNDAIPASFFTYTEVTVPVGWV
ncbi:zeta toxin family protein [Corynebacterium ulcerans]|uniref:zeta toxin family protein n=1 Tax=Corynebacterium ulcerans TaxID=65058 RepID=UPI001E3F9651|nr:zeta toxin family protein [Corynebacterium ulcerans]